MKNTILPGRCTAVREKSATLVETVKVQPYLSTGLLTVGQSCRTVVAGSARNHHPESSVPHNVATVEKGSSLYGNNQPIPRRKTWAGESVAVLGSVI